MFYDFIDDAGGPELAVALGVLTGETFLAEIGIILRAEINALSVLMFDAVGLCHIVRLSDTLIITIILKNISIVNEK
jgi:hypothetical protein